MSTYVLGFKPADEKWNKMKEVWDACKSADVRPPDEVLDFFSHVYPGDSPGMEVQLDSSAVEEWNDDYRSGYQVNLEHLPSDVKYLRFIISY